MKKVRLKIIILTIILSIFIIGAISNNVYAQGEAEELKQILTEYKANLGNINQFKEVFVKMENDLEGTTEVTEELKSKLNQGIDSLSEVEGMDLLIVSVLQEEFKSQISNLTNDNLNDFKTEIAEIKEWANNNVGDGNNIQNVNDQQNNSNLIEDETTEEDENIEEETQGNNVQEENNNEEEELISNVQQNNHIETNTDLPHTGAKSTFMIIVLLTIVAIVLYINYRRYDEV